MRRWGQVRDSRVWTRAPRGKTRTRLSTPWLCSDRQRTYWQHGERTHSQVGQLLRGTQQTIWNGIRWESLVSYFSHDTVTHKFCYWWKTSGHSGLRMFSSISLASLSALSHSASLSHISLPTFHQQQQQLSGTHENNCRHCLLSWHLYLQPAPPTSTHSIELY